MNKRIVVPLDGSELSEMALPHAVVFAQARGYGLTLLRAATLPSVLESTGWGALPKDTIWEGWDEELKSQGRYLDMQAQRLISQGLDVHVKLLEGDPAREIVSYVEQHPEVTLIAMSTHGRSGLKRWVFGSVAEKVLHASSVPLLLVHPKHPESQPVDDQLPRYKSLLVPLDGSFFAAQALEFATGIASSLPAPMTLVSAIPDHYMLGNLIVPPAVPFKWSDETEFMTDYLQHCRRSLHLQGLSVGTRVENGSPAEVVLSVAENLQADPSNGPGEVLIVMATHGRSGLPRLWLGSVAMKVVQASTHPVLLVRAKERVKESDPARAAMALTPLF